ncbi:MAG: hypothetical protein DPW21_00730 [Anaerolineae bacterium]|nr:hypothetical protein [Anaerolineae bacterium]
MAASPPVAPPAAAPPAAPAPPAAAPSAAPTPLAANAAMEATCFTAWNNFPTASAVVVMVILPRMPAMEIKRPVAPHSHITRITADSKPCWSKK